MTEGQVVLRFNLQRGISIIPKTLKAERLIENLDLFGFELSEEDMEKLKGLERNLRFNDPSVYCEKVFNTFCPIFD